jgi:hypothetical protein
MSLIRQHQLNGHLFSRNDRPVASDLFGRSCRLLDAVHALEREAGGRREASDDDGATERRSS